jgi:putative molybdopterin biosynthesis protein
MGVAAAVLSGRADVGLGVKSAAVALGLDFLPVGVEEYDLVIPEIHFSDDRIVRLLEAIRSAEFKDGVRLMGGYGLESTGEVVWIFDGQAGKIPDAADPPAAEGPRPSRATPPAGGA